MNTLASGMPAHIDRKLLHMALAVQSGGVFKDQSALWDFAFGKYKGNLLNLPARVRQATVHSSLQLGDKGLNQGRLLDVNPLKYAEVFGHSFSPLTSAMERCEADFAKKQFSAPAVPFYVGNGIFVTIHDLDDGGHLISPEPLISFGEFRFTKQALLSSAYWATMLEKNTMPLLNTGRQLREAVTPSDEDLWKFSSQVCVWGGRAGVAVKLQRRAKIDTAVKTQFFKWLVGSARHDDPVSVMIAGVTVPELGVSFASKHLRFIAPEKHATFDALLAQVVGLPASPEGYGDFIGLLETIREEHELEDDIATLEMGFFALTKHFFDALTLNASVVKATPSTGKFADVSAEALDREFDKFDDFSPAISLFRRKNTSHVYGFSNASLPCAPGQRKRYPLVLMLMLTEHHGNWHTAYQPDLFTVNHAALRTEFAYKYLCWLLQARHQQHVMPFFLEGWDHPMLQPN